MDSIDNATFFQNLPRDLRRAILSDMDDSLIGHLPEEMRAEAQTLRQERDNRRRQMLEQRHAFLERMMEEAHLRAGQGGGGGGDASSILPPTSWPQLSSQGMRYAVVNLNSHNFDGHVLGALQSGSYMSRGGPLGPHQLRGVDQHSKQMLDQEALTCLLVLLFLDQTKLHNNRLHRIIKNLSQHSPTRAWILSSLLAIVKEMRMPLVQATPPIPISSTCPMPPPLTSSSHSRPVEGGTVATAADVGVVSSSTPSTSTPVIVSPHHYSLPHWLDISINAALGSHAKIFQLDSELVGKAGTGGGGGGGGSKINIHPLAGSTISHNVLDLLIFLGRHFGHSFLPSELLPKEKAEERKEEGSDVLSNFWQILLKLDGGSAGGARKGKGAMKPFKYSENKGLLTEQELFSGSIIGQLLELFEHDIIADNVPLIDKLLRLLSIASSSIPRVGLRRVATPTLPQVTTDQPKGQEQGREKAEATSSEEAQAKRSGGDDSEDVFEVAESHTIRLSVVAAPLLSNVIKVLTSGRCSEEGLEEATTLLTNLSKCSIPTREQILFMLLDGVRTIGQTLCSQIIALDDSVNARIREQALEKELLGYQQDTTAPPAALAGVGKKLGSSSANNSNILSGIVLPSAGGHEEQHTDHSHDLHIPTMQPLTCKGSQQSFFVRMLKVVCQLRESAQLAISAASKSTPAAATANTSAPAGTSATAEPTASEAPQQQQQSSGSGSGAGNGGSDASGTGSGTGGGSGGREAEEPARLDVKPEGVVDTPPLEQKSVFLQTLSQQLELEELWCILSNCLDALSHTQDPHAVFVLQPTVEAFFLVHANYKDDGGQKGRKKQPHAAAATLASRFSRFSSSHILDSESNPTSPSPFSPLPGTPGPGDIDTDPFAHLPPDTAKFLKFAGKACPVL